MTDKNDPSEESLFSWSSLGGKTSSEATDVDLTSSTEPVEETSARKVPTPFPSPVFTPPSPRLSPTIVSDNNEVEDIDIIIPSTIPEIVFESGSQLSFGVYLNSSTKLRRSTLNLPPVPPVSFNPYVSAKVKVIEEQAFPNFVNVENKYPVSGSARRLAKNFSVAIFSALAGYVALSIIYAILVFVIKPSTTNSTADLILSAVGHMSLLLVIVPIILVILSIAVVSLAKAPEVSKPFSKIGRVGLLGSIVIPVIVIVAYSILGT